MDNEDCDNKKVLMGPNKIVTKFSFREIPFCGPSKHMYGCTKELYRIEL